MTPALKRTLETQGRKVNSALRRYLPRESEKPTIIHKAMRYSTEAGGKRLRPVLVLVANEICGGKESHAMPVACALEMIHTYSLIHDDLPAMDNDDLRRGKPTNHKVFGEDIAILAGDSLLTRAFGLIAEQGLRQNGPAKNLLKIVELVAHHAGTFGMVGGQVADITADKGRWRNLKNSDFSSAERLLEFIHLNKTAALIRASLVAGGYVAGANSSKIAALDRYGKSIGLAFQITDDILDRIGDKTKLGKKGSDLQNQKLTFATLYGIERSQKMAQKLISEAKKALRPFGTKGKVLLDLADYILSRDH